MVSPKNEIAGEKSLMTYRGHSILRTLFRCHFSPTFNTGQRYFYTGLAAGNILVSTRYSFGITLAAVYGK